MLFKTSIASVKCVSLEEAKAHLRVDQANEDSLIQSYLQAAIDSCAAFAGRAFDQEEYRFTADAWPSPLIHAVCAFEIPIAPIVEVSALKYLDEDGQEQTVDAADWYFTMTPEGGYVATKSTFTTPTLYDQPGSIRIDLEAGYDPAGVTVEEATLQFPANARAAILLTLGHLYANREDVVVGKAVAQLPMGARSLLSLPGMRIYR